MIRELWLEVEKVRLEPKAVGTKNVKEAIKERLAAASTANSDEKATKESVENLSAAINSLLDAVVDPPTATDKIVVKVQVVGDKGDRKEWWPLTSGILGSPANEADTYRQIQEAIDAPDEMVMVRLGCKGTELQGVAVRIQTKDSNPPR